MLAYDWLIGLLGSVSDQPRVGWCQAAGRWCPLLSTSKKAWREQPMLEIQGQLSGVQIRQLRACLDRRPWRNMMASISSPKSPSGSSRFTLAGYHTIIGFTTDINKPRLLLSTWMSGRIWKQERNNLKHINLYDILVESIFIRHQISYIHCSVVFDTCNIDPSVRIIRSFSSDLRQTLIIKIQASLACNVTFDWALLRDLISRGICGRCP